MIADGSVLDGRYVLEAELGRGGTATVHRARDLKHDRVVAIKILRPNVAAQLGAERFIREIRLAAQLSHPHIVPLFDSGDADGTIYFTMPCFETESLRGRIRREGRLEVATAVTIAREVADALGYAHRKGILHRDVKPENILLAEGHAIVADFGIARALASAADANLTHPGFVVGTPAYMSPEQSAGDPSLDVRSDVFSLGCVLFEMLAGGLPAEGPTVMSSPAQRAGAAGPDIRQRRPEVPSAIADALSRALAHDRDKRWRDVSEFASALIGAAPSSTDMAAKTLAVLPFDNLSAEPDNDYFAEGLADELIADLSKVRSLRVTSRTSVMRMKGERSDLRTIARALGVRYVLEGSVRKSATGLRITARLVDAESDAQIWADKFSGTLEQVFDLQERVSREIVRALDVALTVREERQLSARPLADVRVLDCYLRARHEIYQASDDGLARAERLLQRGLEMSPANPLLEAMLGTADVLRAKTSAGSDERIMARAEERARRVLAADPEFAEGPFLLGAIAQQRGELAESARLLKRAIDLDPNHSDASARLALTYFFAGRIDEARAHSERALALDPLSAIAWSWRAVTEWADGSFAQAASFSERGAQLDPIGVGGHWIHGYTLTLGGAYKAAQAECDYLLSEHPESPYTRQLAGLLYGIAGRTADATELLASLSPAHLDHHESFHVAESYAAAGDEDRALSLLEAAVMKGMYPLTFIQTTNPLFAGLRAHPTFDRIVAFAERRWKQFDG